MLLTGIGGASAAPSESARTISSSPASDYENIQAAVDSAFSGNDEELASLLDGPQSEQTQSILKSRLEERGDFANSAALEATIQSNVASLKDVDQVTPLSTGQYDNYCTGYNGVTIGWYGKEELACHGWMDSYISGRHVAHYNPDLIPRGGPVSVDCAYAMLGAAASLMAPVGVVGWAVYGSGVLYSGGGIVISCG